MTYEEFIKYQEDNLPFGKPDVKVEDIWHFDFSSFKNDLMKSAQFYINQIEDNKYYLKVPCSIVFSNDQSINAKAAIHDCRAMIVWHAGLLLKQCKVLDDWKEIEKAFFELEFATILPSLDNHVSILHYQIIQHLTFYHEFAHIIQLQNSANGNVVEFVENTENLFYKHVLECDADEFASLFLGSHIIQYYKNIFDKVDNILIADLISVFLVGLLTYAISIHPEDLVKFNIRADKHPHPIFRLLYISLVICDYINKSLMDEGVNLKYSEILQKSLKIVSKLCSIDLIEIWQIHEEEMLSYFKDIREFKFNDEFVSAVDAWNNDLKNRA